MHVTIIGAGRMARGIATRLLAGRHHVTLVGREAAAAAALAEQLGPVAQHGAGVSVASLDALITTEVIVLAVPYAAAAAIVRQHGAQLAGNIVIDITNPLNATYDGLVTAPDTSAAEEIAKAAPAGTNIVKAFNTTFAGTLVAGEVAGQPLDVFMAGDDVGAKETVGRLITDGGLRAIDAGPLHRARQLEAMGLLCITLQATLGTGFMSALKILP
jgi:8-hydroxy-5-deazaflavin:NADPH oxidoreductase